MRKFLKQLFCKHSWKMYPLNLEEFDNDIFEIGKELKVKFICKKCNKEK